jgi:hypothetical protein
MNRTLAYTLYKRRLLILVHTKDSPTDAEWTEYAQAASKWKRDIQGFLVITEGGGPNTMQRAELDAAIGIESHSAKTAVVTVSRIARGIVTAISWFSPGIKAFSTNQLSHALEYLGVSATEVDSVNAEIRRLKKELGIPGA